MRRQRQNGEFRKGVRWPVPHFEPEDTVLDRRADLVWTMNANLGEFPMENSGALVPTLGYLLADRRTLCRYIPYLCS